MKKILFMAVAALMFVACNENGPSSADKKCAKVVSSEAVELIGKDMATVDKALTKAGYVQAKEDKAQGAPARVRALVRDTASGMERVMYLYGLPANIDSMTEADAAACLQKALKEGKTVALAYVASVDGKMVGMQTILYMKLQENANKLIVDISNSLYGQIPEGTIVDGQPEKLPYAMWYGAVAVDNEEEPTTMAKHADYTAKIAAHTEVAAREAAQIVESEVKGWMYQVMWINPNEETKKEMAEEIGEAIVYGTFVVGDLSIID